MYIALKRVDFIRKYKSRKKILTLQAAESQRAVGWWQMIAGKSQGELKFMMKHILSGWADRYIIQWDSRQLQDILQVSFWQRNNDNVFCKASRRRRMRQIYKRKTAALSFTSRRLMCLSVDIVKSCFIDASPCLWALNLQVLLRGEINRCVTTE